MRILFEAIPPAATAAAPWREHLARLDGLRSAGVAGLLVPQVEDGDFATAEPVAFAAEAGRRLGLPAHVNRIVRGGQDGWVEQARAAGVAGAVAVGGGGIPVEPALPALARLGPVGVVAIPGRTSQGVPEAQRLARRAAAGATWAVSQILLDAEPACALAEEVADACSRLGVAPPRIHWSLAPVGGPRDLDWLRRLRVHVNAEALALVRDGRPATLEASARHNRALADRVLAASRRSGVPAGLCVSHVTLRNVEAAVALAAALG